jgi:hypothetical protein
MAHAWEGGIVFILNLLIIDDCSRCLADLILLLRSVVGASMLRPRTDGGHGQ